MLQKNVLSQILSFFKRFRFSACFDRDTCCVIVPVPVILLSREGFNIGFLFLFWQIGITITYEKHTLNN